MLGEYKKHRSTQYRAYHTAMGVEGGIKVPHIHRPSGAQEIEKWKVAAEEEAAEAFHEAVRLLASRAGNREGYIPCILGRIHIHSQTLLLSVLCLEDPCPAARASGMSSTLRFFQRPGQDNQGVSTNAVDLASAHHTPPPAHL